MDIQAEIKKLDAEFELRKKELEMLDQQRTRISERLIQLQGVYQYLVKQLPPEEQQTLNAAAAKAAAPAVPVQPVQPIRRAKFRPPQVVK